MLRFENFVLNSNKKILFTIENLNWEDGKKILIFANNNSGKSLLLKSIHRDYFSFKGNIKIKEKSHLFYKKKKTTILIESIPYLLPEESIWKNIILPIPKVTTRLKQKIKEFCSIAGFNDKISHKAKNVSYSEKKFIELIRAVIQLPYLILLDDFDNYFDSINLKKAHEICNFAVNNGSTVVVTSKTRLENFDNIYRIQNKKVVQL